MLLNGEPHRVDGRNLAAQAIEAAASAVEEDPQRLKLRM
jgi:hypothetical protein